MQVVLNIIIWAEKETKMKNTFSQLNLWCQCWIQKLWKGYCYIQVPEQFKCLSLINCGNKSKCFLSFISFIAVSQHRVQVSCTSSHLNLIHAAYAAQYKLPSSFTNSFTAKAVPYMLSSVLTDAMQMLPSAVNSHTKSKKYQYMFVKSCI